MKDKHEERQLRLRFEESMLGDGHSDSPLRAVAASESLSSAKVFTFSILRRKAGSSGTHLTDSQSLVQRALDRVKLF